MITLRRKGFERAEVGITTAGCERLHGVRRELHVPARGHDTRRPAGHLLLLLSEPVREEQPEALDYADLITPIP